MTQHARAPIPTPVRRHRHADEAVPTAFNSPELAPAQAGVDIVTGLAEAVV